MDLCRISGAVSHTSPRLRNGMPSRSFSVERNTNMYYCYILSSSKFHIFYFGSANDLKARLKQHNNGEVKSTKAHLPWKLVWYGAFSTEKEARDFKGESGKAFAYKRLVPVALEKDFSTGRKSSPKSLT